MARAHRFLRSRMAAALGASAVTALLIGGIATAAIPDGDGSVDVCVRKSNGAIRVIDTSKGQRCART